MNLIEVHVTWSLAPCVLTNNLKEHFLDSSSSITALFYSDAKPEDQSILGECPISISDQNEIGQKTITPKAKFLKGTSKD